MSAILQTRQAEGAAAAARSSPAERSHILSTFSRLQLETKERKSALRRQARELLAQVSSRDKSDGDVPVQYVESRSGSSTPLLCDDQKLEEDDKKELSPAELDLIRRIALEEADTKRDPARIDSQWEAAYDTDPWHHRKADWAQQPDDDEDELTADELRQIRESDAAGSHYGEDDGLSPEERQELQQLLDPEEFEKLRLQGGGSRPSSQRGSPRGGVV